jgi:anti-sigma factor RsiW
MSEPLMPENLEEMDIHAFIDDELDAARTRAVVDRMASDPVFAAKVEAYRADKALLVAHYGPLIARPVPQKMTALLTKPQRTWARPRSYAVIMAMAASVMLAVVATLSYRAMVPNDGAVIEAAVAAHNGRGDGEVIAADAAKISETLGLSLKLPDLTKAGYTLAQVAVYPGVHGKGVKIDYRNAAGEAFTLYLEDSSGREQFEITKRGDVLVCLWQDDVLSTVMVGKMAAADMLRVASLAYNGLYF